MKKMRNFLMLASLLLPHSLYAEEAKKEEPKAAEVKKEEPKAEVKPVVPAKPRECFYSAHALALVDNTKFDDEVKKIQERFDKCEQALNKQKEMEVKIKECHALNLQVKEKRMAVLKLASASAKLNKKDEFEKMVIAIKAAKDEVDSFVVKYKEHCPVHGKVEAKKAEVKPAEVKKEEPKKEEVKPVEVKKEEPKKEEVKPVEVNKEEPKKEEVKPAK